MKLSWSRGATIYIDHPALQGNFTRYRITRPTEWSIQNLTPSKEKEMRKWKRCGCPTIMFIHNQSLPPTTSARSQGLLHDNRLMVGQRAIMVNQATMLVPYHAPGLMELPKPNSSNKKETLKQKRHGCPTIIALHPMQVETCVRASPKVSYH